MPRIVRKISALAGALLAAILVVAGCTDEPAVTVDSSLTGLLVTGSDFPAGWHVEDVSQKMAEESANTGTGRADPPDCDSSDKTSLTSGVAAMVSERQGTPGVVATLSREPGSELVAVTEKWLGQCQAFSVEKDGVKAEAEVHRLEPPASKADAQVGFDMTSTAGGGGETMKMMLKGYTAQVGDIIVLCIAVGGESSVRTVEPDVEMLNTVFTAQVAKVRDA
ncbi:hypothetical protein [Mycolicibacterium porcinum]|uniref:Sensor domain-containing protein n=1 Tax=Mycolicibacterium porcinum TaxID=39693 RepID=A0AAW5T718_9MYCO|nr:hypothetical protein [Mycolicibacterium porcinum]MCV7390617.1 hypothetical protein [Mycolicibacterium porcinum]ORB36889.1 hypothetical protein BST41_24550 [Mycolicibacterium porcinum]CDO29290.1 hypothetical protein BN979_02085 [Mycolicibacterium vulneris]